MATAPYNTWYDATYDAILTMANWSVLEEDVPQKVVCVFSWMPQTIMGISHPGGGRKWAAFDLTAVESRLKEASPLFTPLCDAHLQDATLVDEEQRLLKILGIMFSPFGSVAASKFLHFSVPRYFPMRDRSIRTQRRHPDTPAGFLAYMTAFRKELLEPKNQQSAIVAYPANAIRGWDIVNMRNRRAKRHR